jgi:hypothetical protein
VEYILSDPGHVPGMAALERALRALDPAAVVDLAGDATALRISTCATPGEILAGLRAAGMPALHDGALVQVPSVCCGGCSG